jgi:uncharacterized lipoprotein YajG
MKKIVSVLLPLVLLTGCATTTSYVSIDYQPTADVVKVAAADKVQLQLSVTDSRNIKDHISRKRNGFGLKMAPIVSTTELDQLLRQALTQELSNRGFQFTANNGPLVSIDVELSKFYSKFKLYFWSADSIASTILNIKVQNPDGTVRFSKQIEGKGHLTPIFVMSGNNAKEALEKSLQDAIAQIFQDPEFMAALVPASEKF